MGYFANGTEGDAYEAKYCARCTRYAGQTCVCWDAHMLWNYDECNKPDSILHKMIPRQGTQNLQCVFFNNSKGKP